MVAAAAILVLVVCLVAAAASDLAKYRIPNSLCLGVAASFLLYAAAVPLPLAVVGTRLAVCLAVLVVASVGFGLRLMGGGDAKLMAAVALWLGWRYLAPFLLLMAIFGGVLGLALLLARRLMPQPVPDGHWWSKLLLRQSGVPYGVAISLAAIVILARFRGELLP